MDIQARIKRLVPIEELPLRIQEQAVELASIEVFSSGERIFEQGTNGENIHFLLAGQVDLLWHHKVVRTMNATSKAALHALDPAGRKRYTVRTRESATIASFPRKQLNRLTEQPAEPATRELEVNEIGSERSSDWMIRMLQSDLFLKLPAANIQTIFARMQQVHYNNGETVVVQDSEGDFYYVIETGYCEVSRAIAAGRGQIHLADLGPGASFGEEALISGKPRNASITMISDGKLMRLGKQDFLELIVDEVMEPVDLDSALTSVELGAVWLDVRYPEDHQSRAFAASDNIPVSMLRLQNTRLSKERKYIVCADDIDQAAIAAFLMAERGFDVCHLNQSVTNALGAHPELAAEVEAREPTVVLLSDPVHEDADPPTTAIDFDQAQQAEQAPNTANAQDKHQSTQQADDINVMSSDSGPLDNTLTRIAGLYTQAEADREMNDTTPIDKYSDTATGRALADIIDELAEQHNELSDGDFFDVSEDEREIIEMDRSITVHDDMIGTIMREMEQRMREQIDAAVEQRSAQLEKAYRAKVTRMRELTNQEIRNREAALRRRITDEFTNKEQMLRGYYKKLIALANNMSRQKAQLQEAKKHFESKMHATQQLYQELEGMRASLSEHIDQIDTDAIEEIPQLQMNV